MQLNIQVVAKTGEDHVVLSASALDGAVNRPLTLCFYEDCSDVVVLGVRLMSGIANDHCFMQGNKRTAFHACISFMELNEIFLDFADVETNAKLVEDMVTGVVEESTVVAVLRKRQM